MPLMAQGEDLVKPLRRQFASRYPLIEFWFRVQEFLRTRRAFANSEGLRPREYELLLMLKTRADGRLMNVSFLAEHLFVHHHVAAAIVKRLSNRGLVAIRRNRADRRSLSLRLTRQGELLLERIVARSIQGLGKEGPDMISSLGKILREEQKR
jgi:DNA-binding MarR family transcriptional regulator